MSSFAEARIFNLTKEKFASYLMVHAGTSRVEDDLFRGESGAVDFSSSMKNNLGGEFGFISTMGPLSFRFGFEILKPAPLREVKAKDAGGATLYEASSDVTGFIPKVGLDLNLVTKPSYRMFAFGTVGQAHLTVKNEYTNLTVAPNADFSTEMKSSSQFLAGGVGIEYAAFDLTSVVLEVGYKQLQFKNLKYSAAVTDTQGAHNAGDAVLLNTGENRTLDFSGWTVSLGARWWLF
ncbi:MAG: hypothetical protein KF789_02285 [Bdellovibrionaceae bacterium]|nr:hypothetical protein [Pseudobdellovibrionaceae bacterium]